MRYLLLSDLHSNQEALEAVLADAAGQYDLIVSCGDLVGYGPDPNRVVEWARQHLHAVIRGNHDRANCGLEDIEWFNPVAQAATRWTMGMLSAENITYLRNLRQGPVLVDCFLLVHGSPLDEDEYIASMSDAANVFPYLEAGVTFFGHTHLQGGFVWRDGEQHPVPGLTPGESSASLSLTRDAFWLINPGSVGQPRDNDPRAAYAIYDCETSELFLRRTPYDTEAVRRKIERAGLPPVLGSRLAHGR
ncbi:MAG: metallophosphoesterase family protein [Acidobacteriota bacterium]